MKDRPLDDANREATLGTLEAMSTFLQERFAELSAAEAVAEGPDGTFSPVEHCWHLADLEREGFAVRIHRLLEEEEPSLPDFDGARVARERQYRSRSLAEGLAAFRSARLSNRGRLRSLRADQWSRAGTQEGVGRVTMDDLPRMMAEHDAAHRLEIDACVAAKRRRATSPR